MAILNKRPRVRSKALPRLPGGIRRPEVPSFEADLAELSGRPQGINYVPDAAQLRGERPGGRPVAAAVRDILPQGPGFAPDLNSDLPPDAVTADQIMSGRQPFLPAKGGAATSTKSGTGTFLRDAGKEVGSAAKALGKGIADNPLAAVNGALGVAGLGMVAGTKLPELPKFQGFNANLGPARGMDAGLKARLQERISSTRRTSVQEGADNNLNTAARLAAGATAQNAGMDVELKDAEMLRVDEQRLQGLNLEIDKGNYQGNQTRQMQAFDVDNRRAESTRAQGTAMAQGSLDYFTQADAGRRTAEQAAITQANETSRACFSQLQGIASNPYATEQMRTAANAELQQLLAAQKAATVVREAGGLMPVPIFKRGGSLSVTVETKTGRSEGDALATKMVQEFSRNVSRQAVESTRNFAATLRDIYRTRTRPVSPAR